MVASRAFVAKFPIKIFLKVLFRIKRNLEIFCVSESEIDVFKLQGHTHTNSFQVPTLVFYF